MQDSVNRLSRAPFLAAFSLARLVRAFCFSMVSVTLLFLFNNILIFWFGWPGAMALLTGTGGNTLLSSLQLLSYLLALALPFLFSLKNPSIDLLLDADKLSGIAAYIVRFAFWVVLYVGLADAVISFLRVENLLAAVVGEDLAKNLSRASFRGTWVHYPLLLMAAITAWRSRNSGFFWLGLLVVFAEFLIVICRFIFSYEQTFMGDLVRFWYAGLFLFASAYTLLHEGHVRVDVLYASFREPVKARVNIWGALLLGMPLCWVILILGLWDKTSSLNSPMIGFEISQSGYGLYVKYLMAGFLVVFAASMVVQFCSVILKSVVDLDSENTT